MNVTGLGDERRLWAVMWKRSIAIAVCGSAKRGQPTGIIDSEATTMWLLPGTTKSYSFNSITFLSFPLLRLMIS
jgi:hypothetical protein